MNLLLLIVIYRLSDAPVSATEQQPTETCGFLCLGGIWVEDCSEHKRGLVGSKAKAAERCKDAAGERVVRERHGAEGCAVERVEELRLDKRSTKDSLLRFIRGRVDTSDRSKPS